MAPKTATKPGFKLQSKNFIICFKSASQSSKESKLLEEYTDWREVMGVILRTCEAFPNNVKRVQEEAARRLEIWSLTQPGGAALQLKVRIDAMERRYYKQDQNKCFFLRFNDVYKTLVYFSVRRKQRMLDLRTIAAAKVTGCMVKKEHFKELELPRDVLPDLHEAFDDNWRVKYINTSDLKRKIDKLSLDDLRKKKDCPYCGRKNFKKIVTHVMRTDACHTQYSSQLQHNYVINNCFW